MSETTDTFEEGPVREMYDLVLDLDGFEGPIDLLLTLARQQKVDLTKISILTLAEQYLSFITAAKQLRLEIAADYLVMAAWLAYLKSRLLLPETEEDEEASGPELAEALTFNSGDWIRCVMPGRNSWSCRASDVTYSRAARPKGWK